MASPTLFNLQKFSIHDGDGIRTTVFFKGCPLRCRWCHNPESQRFEKELMFYADRCTACGACKQACPLGAADQIAPDRDLCTACGRCVSYCLHDAREVVGYEQDLDQLIEEIVKDTPFYEVSGGGVTLSGGEPLAQNMDYIEGLCKRLKRRGYHINIDTCGHVPYEHFARVLPYVDTFLYDLKHMDPEKHTALTGISNERILDNLRRLSADGASINIRMPLISGLNDSDEEIAAVLDFLSTIHVASINLLPYHKTGSDKYARLGEEACTNMQAPSQERMEYLRSLFESKGFISVKIGG